MESKTLKPEEVGEAYCCADYTLVIEIEGIPPVEVGGWLLCGWLPPGSNMDLDGSGLALWGDSQPGGWVSCHGDGEFNGKPRICSYRGEDDWSSPLRLEGGEGRSDAKIPPDYIPEWKKAVDEAEALEACEDDSDEAWDEAELARAYAREVREAVAEALETAIEAAVPEDVPEPEDEEVFDSLLECDECEAIRYGNWRSAGYVLAVRVDDDEYVVYPHPDERDVERALERAQGWLTGEIWARIKKELKLDDNDYIL